jgi:probable phosphoglycerate mutase
MARQISGQYKVRSPDLKPLYDKARAMIARLEFFSIRHVYREQNREADRLANQARDDAERGTAPRAPAPQVPSTAPPTPASQPGVAVLQAPAPQPAKTAPPTPQPIVATFQGGMLHPHTQLPLLDGEEVELEIRRKK